MRILFRADGNARIGLGHVVRSLALADIVRTVGPCSFAVQAPSPAVQAIIEQAGCQLLPLAEMPYAEEARYLATQVLGPHDIVVLDGYEFDSSYQATLKTSGCRLVCIDDLRTASAAADLIINHSPGVSAALYQAGPTTRFCLGPAFSLLRPPFLERARPPQALPVPLQRALLCFGGADPLQLTARCLKALLAVGSLNSIGLLLGAAAAPIFPPQLEASTSATVVETYRNLSAAEMVTLLEQVDLVVCPASSILIESLVLGKAAITGYYVANQAHLATYVHEQRQAYSVGNFTALTDYELSMALEQGMSVLQATPRQPYVHRLTPEVLRQEFLRLQAA